MFLAFSVLLFNRLSTRSLESGDSVDRSRGSSFSLSSLLFIGGES